MVRVDRKWQENRGGQKEQTGSAFHNLEICDDEEAKIYSDVLLIDAEVESWKLAEKTQ